MSEDIQELINQLDKHALSLAREQWTNARTFEDERKWRKRIDELLDERLVLMKKRDILVKKKNKKVKSNDQGTN